MADESGNRQNNTENVPDQDYLYTGIVRALPERLLARRAYLLGRLGREARRRFTQMLGAWNLNPSHYAVLLLLEEIGQASQQHLAETLAIDRANMVALLDLLQRRELIERAVDPLDRRRHVVKLTAVGQQEMQQIRHAEQSLDDAFFAGLASQEQEDLQRLLTRLFHALTHQTSLSEKEEDL